jgi:hypothetical protein
LKYITVSPELFSLDFSSRFFFLACSLFARSAKVARSRGSPRTTVFWEAENMKGTRSGVLSCSTEPADVSIRQDTSVDVSIRQRSGVLSCSRLWSVSACLRTHGARALRDSERGLVCG